MELIIYIKMNLALNNQQMLIYHKTQPTKQTNIYIYIYMCVCVCVYVCVLGSSYKLVNFAQGKGTRKHCLYFYLFQWNQ